jgi:hypothetical protein
VTTKIEKIEVLVTGSIGNIVTEKVKEISEICLEPKEV